MKPIFKKTFPNGNFVCVDYIFLNDTIVYRFSVNNNTWNNIPEEFIKDILLDVEAKDKGLDERDKKLENAYKFLTNLGFSESC